MPHSRYTGLPMTLGNMRANGVRRLHVSCWECRHSAVLDVDQYGDEVPVPSFGPRILCRHIRREIDGSITIRLGGATLTDHRILPDTETLADADYFALVDKACPVSRPTDRDGNRNSNERRR